ncbi:dihydrolipoyl dehydrogenase [Aureococcus anophagefferens]|nr:dihydrolipoyl dehydrogenase [Aureococcus anophagefferens]
MSEADAAAVLAALDAGETDINNLLGSLYNKGKSPEITIPRGNKNPACVAPEYAMGPADCEHVVSAVAHVGPKAHFPKLKENLGKKALLIEKHYMGGDCLNVGCFPSKALIACARKCHELKHAADFGVTVSGDVTVDFGFVMKRMRALRAGIAPHDGVERYGRDFCDDVCVGVAKFASPTEVVITSRGRDAKLCRRARACLIGAGPIGIEMAQSLQRFGCAVTIFEVAPQLLPREDPDAAKLVTEALIADGVEVHYAVKITGIKLAGELAMKAPWPTYDVSVTLSDGTAKVFQCEALLNATGRAPNVSGIGLDEAGVDYDTRTGVHISDLYETSAPNIYSCGDCASPYKFTHAADWQARCAVRNMFLQANSKHSDLLVPWATYTDPEIAHVGLYEKEMDDKGIAYDTYVRQFKDVDRCKCEGVTSGFVKISCAKGSDQILGSTIVGPCAGDLISEITVCMQNGIGCKDIAGLRTPAVNAAIEKRLEQVATGTVPEKTDMMAGAAESLNKAVGDVTASVTAMFK